MTATRENGVSIVLEHLTKRYGGYPVVNRVSLEIPDGNLFVLLGPSGSGKSTILRMIAGLTEVDEGRVWLQGKDVTGLPPQRRDTGFCFQHYALFRHMSVRENIEFGLRVRKEPAPARRKRSDELLEIVGLAGLGGRMPSQLSGGQQQRVALARALAHRPPVLLLDEPFGALDAKIRAELRRTLKRIQRELGVTTLFVTHDQEEAFELADVLGVMNYGRLLETGPPDELYHHPQTEFVATFLGTANLLVGQCLSDAIRVGPMRFPLGTTTQQLGEAPRVQVLFRPEDVTLSARAEPWGEPPLGKAEVEHTTFAGSMERLRLRLPPITGVRCIAPPPPFGSSAILVEAIRSQDQARRLPLRPGDPVFVGVRRIHALPHPGLSFLLLDEGGAPGAAAVGMGGRIAQLAHARVTLAAIGATSEVLQKKVQEIRERYGAGLASLDAYAAGDSAGEAVSEEAQRRPHDLVVLGFQSRPDLGLLAGILEAGEHHVLLVPGPGPVARKALVCTAHGEPGKRDILFAGRLLRHLGTEVTLLSVLRRGAAREGLERHLEAGVRTLSLLGVPARPVIREGDVRDEVEAELSSGHDLLVLGAPLPGRDGKIPIDGVIREILEEPRGHPVLVVHSPYVGAVAPRPLAASRLTAFDEEIR